MIHKKLQGLARPAAWFAVLAVAVAAGPVRAADLTPEPEVSAQDRAARVLLLGHPAREIEIELGAGRRQRRAFAVVDAGPHAR